MKKLFLTIAVFSILLLIGCQENSITDPIQDTQIQKNEKPLVNRGTMILEGILADPSQMFNSYLEIRGGIDFVHETILVDPIQPSHQQYVTLNLSVNAEIYNLNPSRTWKISTKTEDVIYVSEDDIYQLVKSFPIQDRSDGMVLVCSFLVTANGVRLNTMWLAEPEDDFTFNKTNELDPVTMPPVQLSQNLINQE